ncbi:small ribosomal subunit protein uS2-like [Silene latifolia]|uniref:small ribosomal subunit protein uS2-like n=1 Tax=Silene latifolia TaxID=37657 RepID=UPI003D78217C
MGYVDIGIPANNKGKHSIGCLFWLLARMVLQMRGTLRQGQKWDVMVDLFFYREPEEAKEPEDEEVAQGADYGMPDYAAGALGAAPGDWGGASDANWADTHTPVPADCCSTVRQTNTTADSLTAKHTTLEPISTIIAEYIPPFYLEIHSDLLSLSLPGINKWIHTSPLNKVNTYTST